MATITYQMADLNSFTAELVFKITIITHHVDSAATLDLLSIETSRSMEPLLERLSGKDHLDVSDASDLLQFLQCQSEPILSHHTSPSTTTSRSSPTVAHTTAAVAVARSGSRSHNCSDLARSNTLDSCTRGETFHS